MAALSPSAVKAANEALWAAHPELERQQLSSSHPQYGKLKNEWLEHYKKAKEPPNAKPVGSPCATCALVSPVEEREVQDEAAKLLERLIALSSVKGWKNTYDTVVYIFAFDSKWHDNYNNQRLFSFRGKNLKGTNLNYYFQGVIWSWLELPKVGLGRFAQLYKRLRWGTGLSPEAQWALEQGYQDGPSLLSAAPAPPAQMQSDEPPVQVAWGAKVSPEFKSKVIELSAELECDPSHLMAAMAFETGEAFSPSIENQAGSGAVGLIQFLPSTAVGLGTTADALAKMTAEEQLVYVRKHFVGKKGKLKTLSDVYMAILYPVAVGESEDYVLFTKPSTAYTQNSGLDLNGDGTVTKEEATTPVNNKFQKGMGEGIKG